MATANGSGCHIGYRSRRQGAIVDINREAGRNQLNSCLVYYFREGKKLSVCVCVSVCVSVCVNEILTFDILRAYVL
jgi:hypothetical protein